MSNTLKFYQDQIHPCSYLEQQQARNIYPDPHQPMTNSLYSHLIQHGFRRSGEQAYRPYCPDCHACVPVRINTHTFRANRSQLRCLKRNKDVSVSIHSADFNPEHFQLYSRYIRGRHQGGGMDNPTEESYTNFLTSTWSDTGLIEFRLQQQLIAVAVTDFIHDGASAFYTFFDPNMAKRSLGTFAILQQLQLAKTHDISWLYLGYWIKDCQKMRYKQSFSAVEGYINQQWQPLNNLKNFE